MPFYAKIATRSSGAGAGGSPTQAMDYLTDDHDSKRETNLDSGEIAYIARMDEGWKRELEGGEIPLHGFGRSAGLDSTETRAQFEYDTVPHYQPANGSIPTTGYKSITLTVPKEVSLYAEGHPLEAKAAMVNAIQNALDKAYPGKEISGVGAIHTRNENGEVHFHAHVLVAKFAKDTETGKWGSLNKSAGREEGRLKAGWTEGIQKEFHKTFGITIDQRSDGKAVIHLQDGTRLDPLNRNSRRALEKEMAPLIQKTRADGTVYSAKLTLNVMDQKIYEIAAADRGRAGWSREAFEKAFSKEAKHLGRYENRIETLKGAGYLSAHGRITKPFKEHASLKWGTETPQLQQLKTELHREALKNASEKGKPLQSIPFSQAALEKPLVQERLQNLGISRTSLNRADNHRQISAPSVSLLDRKIAALETRLEQLPEQRTRQMKQAGSMDQMNSIHASFQKKEADLRVSLGELQKLKPSPEKPHSSFQKNGQSASRAAQRFSPEESKEGSKDVRHSLKMMTSKDSFRSVQMFMGPEAGNVLNRVQMAASLLNQAHTIMKSSKISVPLDRIEHLARGIQEGVYRKDPQAQLLKGWRGREGTLATKTTLQAEGKVVLPAKTYEASKALESQGARLIRSELPGPPLRVPTNLASHTDQLERLNRRFEAYGLKAPFDSKSLQGISHKGLEGLMKTLEDKFQDPKILGAGSNQGTGIDAKTFTSAKGSGWATASPAQVTNVHAAVVQTLMKALEKIGGLEKGLGL